MDVFEAATCGRRVLGMALALALALGLTGPLSTNARADAGAPAARETMATRACAAARGALCLVGLEASDRSRAFAMTHLQAALTGDGSITGNVTDAATKAPLEDVAVCAESQESFVPDCGRTEKNGAYTIDVGAGAWVVSFVPLREDQNYAPQYWNGHALAAEADRVVVRQGEATEDIDAALTTGAEITGLVESKESDTALGATVCAVSIDDLQSLVLEPDCANTKETGKYTITNLPAGEFVLAVLVELPYASTWLGGASEIGAADRVQTQAGLPTSAPTANVPRGATISGRVVDAVTKAPIKEAEVCLDLQSVEDPCTLADEAGMYSLEGLPAGSYAVGVEEDTPGYVAQFYSGASELRAANFVTVAPGDRRTDVDFALTTGATLTGRVTSAATKLGVKEIEVCPEDPAQERFIEPRCATTNGNGEYQVKNVPPGEYVVSFETYSTEFASQVYPGKALFDEGAELSVTGTGTYAHLDAELRLGAKISGTVTAGGHPVEGVEACALSIEGGEFGGCGSTGADGSYTIRDLPSGVYKVEFASGFSGSPNVAPQFFADKTNYDEAIAVSVAAGETTPDVNAAMDPGGQIEGTVRDGLDGEPVRGAVACLYEGGDRDCARTTSNGRYTLSGLAAATEDRVEFLSEAFLATQFADQFYNHAEAPGEAAPVGVGQGETTDGIDAGLVLTAAPVAEEAPFVWGSAVVGHTLRDGPGDWLNAPTSYGYQWLRCNAGGAACTTIAGATGRTYTVTSADAGQTLRIEETASSEYGAGAPSVSGDTQVVPGTPAEPKEEQQQQQQQQQQKQQQQQGGGVLSTSSGSPSVTQLLDALLSALTPHGKEARIAKVSKHGRYLLSFIAPAAGEVVITWLLVPSGAHVSRAKKHPKPVVVASGRAVATNAGKLSVLVKLNAKGKSLFAHARRVKLTAKGSFQITGHAPVSVTKMFVLH